MFYCIKNGKKIAQKTANLKVGIVGGISILGTTGWVKPISASSYINSIKTQLEFAKINGYKNISFTLGNSALKQAQKENKGYIIEIGNFIYDGIEEALKKDFEKIYLYIGIAKTLKIAQGFKNTHNRFGSIDFKHLSKILQISLNNVISVKRAKDIFNNDKKFNEIIIKLAQKQLQQWFNVNSSKLLIIIINNN
jgi:cobalt-precorrin-5B (C1)-methyltransferase